VFQSMGRGFPLSGVVFRAISGVVVFPVLGRRGPFGLVGWIGLFLLFRCGPESGFLRLGSNGGRFFFGGELLVIISVLFRLSGGRVGLDDGPAMCTFINTTVLIKIRWVGVKFHGLLEGLFGSPVRTKVFALFVRFPTKPFSGREVARLCGLSSMAAWHAIKAFEAEGLVHRARVGSSDVLTLNPKHFLAKKPGFLAHLDALALGELKKVLLDSLPTDRMVRMYLYGSVARKEERPTSDVDVLVIVRRAKDKEAVTVASGNAALKVIDLFGNALSVVAFTEDEFKKDLDLFKEVKKDGVILFDGGVGHG